MKKIDVDLSQHSILLFDGDCHLCSSSVRFILQRDKKGYFKFASLQSDAGRQLIQEYTTEAPPDSMILISSEGVFFRSQASFKICKHLNGLWKCLIILKIFPKFILDPLYDIIARHRSKLFKSSCLLSDKDFKDRFL